MDCSSKQTCSGIRRPQMPEPPCRNTNCSFSGMEMPGNALPLRPAMPPGSQANRPPAPQRPAPQPPVPPIPQRPNGSLNTLPYAMGYVPSQRWNQTYSLEQGLDRGTIFPDLDLPFGTGRSRR